MTATAFDPGIEFDRQVQVLVEKGYPQLAKLTADAFVRRVAPLRNAVLSRGPSMEPPSANRIPFLLVATRDLAPVERTIPLTTLAGKSKAGIIDRHYAPGELETFVSRKDLEIPDSSIYLLFDIHRGEEFCGVVPNDAMATIAGRERTLLTIDEGIAVITLYPQILEKNKCFSLGGSRSEDRRVPALWISQGAPKLGWCWEGNPHTWLGMASARDRDAATVSR